MKDEELKPVDTITPAEAGRILRMNAGTVRAGLRQGRFSFGTAIPPEKPRGQWTYNLIKNKVLEYAGILIKSEVTTDANSKQEEIY